VFTVTALIHVPTMLPPSSAFARELAPMAAMDTSANNEVFHLGELVEKRM
jgi:hypothetical protein